MRPTLDQLRGWDPASLASAARRLAAASRAYSDGVAIANRLVEDSAGYWTGPAAAEALERSGREFTEATRVSAVARRMSTSLESGAAAIESARTTALDVAERAGSDLGLYVAGDGRVSAPRVPWTSALVAGALVQARLNEAARVCQARLSAALDTADEADSVLARELRRGVDELSCSPDEAATPSTKESTPEDNSRYWSDLSEGRRRWVLAEHPEWVGGRDGIPAYARDEANRAVLAADRKRLERRIEQLRAGAVEFGRGGVSGQLTWAAVAAAGSRLGEIEAVERALGHPDRQLLVYRDAGEHVQAAVAVGDVDSADHVAAYTPGVNANVADGLEGYTAAAARLRDETVRQLDAGGRGSETVATIAWLDYRAPQLDLDHPLDAATDLVRDLGGLRGARDGGRGLASFLAGIVASRTDDPHLTVLGHSYGSTTTGLALQHGGTGVDDAVFLGSPGIGTDRAGDLGLPPGHVYVAEAHGDPVADLAAFGPDPNRMDGVTNLSTSAATTPDGRPQAAAQGHSQYLDDGTLSLYNMGAVVGGMPGHLVEGTDEGIADRLPGSLLNSMREMVFGGGLAPSLLTGGF
ncbi:alpha/beta hydrolase [Rhodococcus sp. NPDC127528]|uniref:alpha/beta hydrolase n=1 Tax=unclassified Rhodococcus (in: high G+C Gram-positive bacteria) TaxID=192944 RepID=UPI00362B0521